MLGQVVEERVGYELKRVQQALRAAMDGALRGLGLTTPQYAALAFIEQAPGASSAELARRSFVTAQTMNRIVGNLEAAGLLHRRPHPVHGRILEAMLTEQGRALVAVAHLRVRAVEDRMLSGLGPDEQRRLLDMLRRCAGALGSPEDHAARATG
ncbi:MarR family transcriptional regulator [soil metagenome]